MFLLSHSVVSNSFATSWTVAHQAPLSMVFSRQEYWSGLPFPFPGVLPNPRTENTSPALASRFFTSQPWEKPYAYKKCTLKVIQILPNQSSSVAQSGTTLCDPRNRSTPGFPVHHQLPESTQTHGHWVGDAIQPCHPLLSPSPPTLNLSQHQGLFKWVSSSHQVSKLLEFQLQ